MDDIAKSPTALIRGLAEYDVLSSRFHLIVDMNISALNFNHDICRSEEWLAILSMDTQLPDVLRHRKLLDFAVLIYAIKMFQ